jgi:hypothetical protein
MLAGCIHTRIQADWRDPDFHGKFRKVLVICLAQEGIIRTALEDNMAAQFTARGVEAAPSHAVLGSLRDIDREIVRRKVREIDADGVFLVRPVGHEISDHVNLYSPEDAWEATTLTVETYKAQVSLYEVVKGKVVWEALSDTIVGGPWMDNVKEFTRIMGAKLIEHGLI